MELDGIRWNSVELSGSGTSVELSRAQWDSVELGRTQWKWNLSGTQ